MKPQAKPETHEAYLHGGERHLRRARSTHPDIADRAEALVTSIETDPGVLVTRTVCLYRAQIAAMLRSLVPDDPGRRDALHARVEAALQRRRGRPDRPRTASRKRRSVPADEVRRLLAALAERVWANPAERAPAMLALAVFVHSRIGHRPIEGGDARLEGTWLVLRNAKANADRAGAPERRLDLGAMSPLVRRAICAYLRLRDEMVGRYGDYDGWYRAAAEQLGRLCEGLGIARVAFTSLRHVALATWKRAGLAPWVIAALAGHASDRSAPRYYAEAGSGWAVDGLPRADLVRVLLLEERAALRAERRVGASSPPGTGEDLSDLPPIAPPPRPAAGARSRREGDSLWADYAARQRARAEQVLGGIGTRTPSRENDRAPVKKDGDVISREPGIAETAAKMSQHL